MTKRSELIRELTRSGPFAMVDLPRDDGPPIPVYREAPASLRAVLESTRAFGDLPFLLYQGEVLTFREHFQAAASLAHRLRAAGVAKGDRVAIGMRNFPEWCIGFWACQAIGALSVSLNAWWTADELAYAIEDSTPAALLVDRERLERMRGVVATGAFKLVVIARDDGSARIGTPFDALTAPMSDLPDVDIDPDDPATILFTSGTTGRSKGALASHRNHVSNLMNCLLIRVAAQQLSGAEPVANAPQAGTLLGYPLFHIGGFTNMLIALSTGAKLAMLYKWDAAEAVRLIDTHALTVLSGVPFMSRQALDAAEAAGSALTSIKSVNLGGAPSPPELIRRVAGQLGASASNAYGLTETTSAVISNAGEDFQARPDSVGVALPTGQVRVVDEDGNACPTGTIGELQMRGSTVIGGYWGNPAATEAAFGGGWFRSGDLGYVDEDGFYYVVDRLKDVIIRGGENVYCAEVEAAIMETPGVIEAAVVGVPDPLYGERVAAVIQTRDGTDPAAIEATARETVAARIARFKVPEQWAISGDPLPRNATGKVLKRELQGRFART